MKSNSVSGILFAGLVWPLCSVCAAQADDLGPWLGTGALLAKNQKAASCTVANVTSHDITVTEVSIFSSDGSPVTITSDNCPSIGVLKPGRACNQNAALSASLLYSCKVAVVTPFVPLEPGVQPHINDLGVRGTLIIYDNARNILGSSDLR